MDKKLGLGALISLVIGSMVGAGVFSLPQNIAAVRAATEKPLIMFLIIVQISQMDIFLFDFFGQGR